MKFFIQFSKYLNKETYQAYIVMVRTSMLCTTDLASWTLPAM